MSATKSASVVEFSKMLAVAALAGIGCVAPVHPAYPTKPVTLVMPYPAGGANDMLGRLMAELSKASASG